MRRLRVTAPLRFRPAGLAATPVARGGSTGAVGRGSRLLRDPVLLVLSLLLAITLLAFLAGVTPYPFGVLVLLILVVARVLYRS